MTQRWKNLKVRLDLYDRIAAQASAQSRSVAGQLDHLLLRALDQGPNTSASSGGGHASQGEIPGESGRGAGVGPPVEPASAPDRAPGEHVAPSVVYANQITVEEAITRCPVCNDALDDERRCVDPDCTSHRATA